MQNKIKPTICLIILMHFLLLCLVIDLMLNNEDDTSVENYEIL
jgi:hypothetical protein